MNIDLLGILSPLLLFLQFVTFGLFSIIYKEKILIDVKSSTFHHHFNVNNLCLHYNLSHISTDSIGINITDGVQD